jgi:hypothetical protein
MVEVVLKEDNSPAIIIRDPRGNIVKITSEPSDIATFLSTLIEKLAAPAPANN